MTTSKGRPDFIPRNVFRQWSSAAQLNRWLMVDGIQAASYCQRRARLGRPIPSRKAGDGMKWRLLDVVAAARADGYEITPAGEKKLGLEIADLKLQKLRLETEIQSLRKAVKFEVSFTDLNVMSEKLASMSLARESEIVRASIKYEKLCGVYFLIRGQQVVYVGQSVSVYSRLEAHWKDPSKDFDSFSVVPCKAEDLDGLESLYIHLLQPELNGGTSVGVGKSAPLSMPQLVAAIRDGLSPLRARAAEAMRKDADRIRSNLARNPPQMIEIYQRLGRV